VLNFAANGLITVTANKREIKNKIIQKQFEKLSNYTFGFIFV